MDTVSVVVFGDHSVSLPVSFSTKRGEFVVADNRSAQINLSFATARRNPYIVVHRQTGLRVPRPHGVDRVHRFEAGAIARWLSRNASVEDGVILVDGKHLEELPWHWSTVAPKGRSAR